MMDWCSVCADARNVRVSYSVKKVKDSRSRIKNILVRSFHCEVCGSFIRNEDLYEKLEEERE